MQVLTAVVAAADMAETDRLLATLEAWWPAIECASLIWPRLERF